MDGILNIAKPTGKTSYNIVAMVKRLTGEKRVGHAGTLDPMASGVLPVCLGQATRLVEYLMDTTKTYCAEIELGVTTDTLDSEGKVTRRCDVSGLTLEKLEEAMVPFRGVIEQTPPMYSAVKHHGKPLYELARAGIAVERKSRTAVVHSLELKRWQSPILTIEVTCGKGTYIRSLADDLGKALGCGASIKNLVRSRYGIFDINDAVSPECFQEACAGGYWESLLAPMDNILTHWSAIIVNEETERLIRNGTPVSLDGASQKLTADCCRAYTWNGNLLAVLRFDSDKNQWHPEKVFVGN